MLNPKYRQDWKSLAKTFTIEKTSENRYSIKRAGLTMCKNLKFQKSNEIELQNWINEWMSSFMNKNTGLTKYDTSKPNIHNPTLCDYVISKYKDKYESKKQKYLNAIELLDNKAKEFNLKFNNEKNDSKNILIKTEDFIYLDVFKENLENKQEEFFIELIKKEYTNEKRVNYEKENKYIFKTNKINKQWIKTILKKYWIYNNYYTYKIKYNDKGNWIYHLEIIEIIPPTD